MHLRPYAHILQGSTLSLRIDSLVLREVRIPLRTPFRTSGGTTTERRVCVLELRADGEAVAWSECVAGERPDYTAETIDTAWHVLERYAAPSVLGRAFDSPEEVADALSWIRGHPMARAALEMGFWAFAARRADRSLASFLGGVRDRVETGATLGIDEDPERMAARARAAVEAGFRKVKMKIAPGLDLEPARRVREAIGPGVALAADANGAYRIQDADHLARFDPLELSMLEQPLPARDFAGLAFLQKRLATPICLDESIETVADVETMVALGAGRIVNIKPGRVGGLAESLRIHDECARHGIPVWCGGMLETGLGRAYNAALASLPNFSLPGDLYPASSYLASDIAAPEAVVEGGSVAVPDGPGVGVEVDVERVEGMAVRREVIWPAAGNEPAARPDRSIG